MGEETDAKAWGERHNGGMPKLKPAAPDMPQGAERAHRAIATTTRIEAIKYLLGAPDSAMAAIVAGTGLTRESVRSAIDELERLEYLHASDAPGARRGRIVTYRVDRTRLAQDLGALNAYLLG